MKRFKNAVYIEKALEKIPYKAIRAISPLIDLRLIFPRAIAEVWGQFIECTGQSDHCVHVAGQPIRSAVVGTSHSHTIEHSAFEVVHIAVLCEVCVYISAAYQRLKSM